MVSPRARRGHVAHDVYDHTSVLKMIEWRWGLAPLTPRDAAARNIAEVLDFGRAPDLTAPRWRCRPRSAPPAGRTAPPTTRTGGTSRRGAVAGWRVGGVV